MKRVAVALLLTIGLLPAALAKDAAAVAKTTGATRIDALRHDVEFLAAPELAGRMTGTPGGDRAAAYIAKRLETLGAVPVPGQQGFGVSFEFTAGMSDGGSRITVHRDGNDPQTWSGAESVQALSFSDTDEVRGPVVFAGYGLVVPEGQDFGYDSYFGLDLEGKIVVVLRYFPEDTEGDVRDALARYSGLRYKAMQARERGAIAMLVITGPRSPDAGQTVPMAFDTALAGSGIVAASAGAEVASALFAKTAKTEGRDLEQVQASFDSGNPHVTGFDLPGVTLTLSTRVNRERRTAQNVVGILPANDMSTRDDRFIVLGAHYDHLGQGKHGNSLARKDEAGQIHHGADDNASGVAAVLEIARRLADGPRGRPVALAFWAGEELGLLGSNAFIKDAVVAEDKILAYVNFDMVGRMRDDKLSLQAVGSSSVWAGLVERSNVPVGLDISTQQDPYLPTDSAAFYQAGVPTINFFTGSHEDYHRPTDTADRINYDGLDGVATFGTLLVQKLAALEEAPDYKTVARKSEGRGDRDTVRAFTGTIPDYSAEAAGLLLSGVIEGGPAAEAGLSGGDVIVEFNDKTIANIYDYTYALDGVKIGKPVKVVFIREGERREVTLTPTSRNRAQ